MSSQPLVVVTGVSGFTASHVVDELLRQGHRVRGTVRPAKVALQKEAFASYGDRVEIVGFDLITGDLSAHLDGVHALIHVASPLPGRTDPEITINSAVEGTLNVIRQAQKAGIKHISVAGSLAATIDLTTPKFHYTEKDWNPTTKEQAIASTDDYFVYFASKSLAERALWECAEEHPDLNVTTINGSFFIGPFASKYIIEPGSASYLSTNFLPYNMMLPGSTFRTPVAGYVDVRDIARALIAGTKIQGKHRVLLAGEWFQHHEAIDFIASEHPELKDRLPTIAPTIQTEAAVDISRAVSILGIPFSRSWKESVRDAIDAMIKVEKEWTEKGIDVDTILRKNAWRTIIPW